MSDPVLVAVPPKGGSLDDVLKRLVARGWVRPEVATELRRLLKEDKRRVKLEEGLIALWDAQGGDEDATLRAADRFGHDLGDIEAALRRMRRLPGESGRSRLDYTDRTGVEALLGLARQDPDPEIRDAAACMTLSVDATRPGRPHRCVFDQLEITWTPPCGSPIRAVLLGTDHEVGPMYLRKHKRDLTLTCYDAFQNTLLDALDTPRVRNWRDLTAHLNEANADVRILGSLGLDDYLGHCVLMGSRDADAARRAIAAGADRRWDVADGRSGRDAKLPLLTAAPVLIDPQYAEIYAEVLDARGRGITLAPGPKDIERVCAEEHRVAIYIVRSGATVAMTPGLCVVGEELITSETIVAANRSRMDADPALRRLIDSLEPSQADHTPAWRAGLARKLGARLV